MDYQPDFTVSAAAISMVAEISALIERYTITQEASNGTAPGFFCYQLLLDDFFANSKRRGNSPNR